MTRDEAEQEAGRRNGELKDGSIHRWFARADGAGAWTVMKVAGLAGISTKPLKDTTEAKPRPPTADDPRPAYWRNTGGPWVG